MTTTITGRVSDLLEHGDADQYVLPDAALYHWEEGEDLAVVDPNPEHWSRSIPWPLSVFSDMLLSQLPKSISPPTAPAVIFPAGSVAVGDEIAVEAEPVLDESVPAADGETVTYRAVSDPHPHAGGSRSYSDHRFTGGGSA